MEILSFQQSCFSFHMFPQSIVLNGYVLFCWYKSGGWPGDDHGWTNVEAAQDA